jgi:hypothetical protein
MDLDVDMLQKLRDSKSMKKGSASADNEGMTRVRFTRKWQENYGGGAPKVTKADGTAWDFDEDGAIGNGSVVEVLLNVYDTSRKSIVGTRLEKVKVLEHVKYEPDEDEDDAPAPAKQDRQPTSAKKPKAAPVDDLEDDEIPF